MFGDFPVHSTIDETSTTKPIAPFGGDIKITENESPLPENRIYVNYNYYEDVPGIINTVHRETLGIEKTLFRGRASVGLRLPFFQVRGRFNGSDTDDLNIVIKLAPFLNREKGNVFSAGLVITAPTSTKPLVPQPPGLLNHPTYLQPFIGYVWNGTGFYVHGFTSSMLPTDSRSVKFLFNSIAVGRWVYKGSGTITGVVPTLETHLNTPLSSRGKGAPVRYYDSLDLTGGINLVLNHRYWIGLGIGTPLTHPRLFKVEVIPRFNWSF